MSKSVRNLVEEWGRKAPRHSLMIADFEKVSAKLEKHHIHLRSGSLRKLWGYVVSKEKPSQKSLDRLALFAGFQSWKDFQKAIHGDGDGQLNYED
ncbi:hypothetical protein ETF27_03755 [Prevotella brunnea]|uniref:Uncharacterized protein n=1 Tax=Prevotella brunnea TaxID=2508867 RepID=A0A5C8GL53_9BACT|nr:hypothetical protein [Prevotella brunnea]MDR0185269.1 hypothetical protein [Prevotella brunnea]TXJ62684.1 hypothetical protein ETF27_03755 [Prevotella brunnea]